jgi:hypothetical protein
MRYNAAPHTVLFVAREPKQPRIVHPIDTVVMHRIQTLLIAIPFLSLVPSIHVIAKRGLVGVAQLSQCTVVHKLFVRTEIRVLTEFHAYLQNLFICKTRTGRPLVFAIRFWNLRLLKSHWRCMAAKSGLIQVGVGCERAKPQR